MLLYWQNFEKDDVKDSQLRSGEFFKFRKFFACVKTKNYHTFILKSNFTLTLNKIKKETMLTRERSI